MLRGMHIIGVSRKPSKTYGKGRVCAEDGCAQVLSMYNPSDRCHVHTAEMIQRMSRVGHCHKCNRDFLLTEEFWHRDRARKSGFHAICKTCRMAQQKKRIRSRRNTERVAVDAAVPRKREKVTAVLPGGYEIRVYLA